MDRGHNREAIFADADDRHAFLRRLGRYQSRFGLRLYHYCLMTTHIHMLVQLENAAQVSALMAGLLRAYVHHCHRRHGFVGHRWQGRFQSPAVQCSEYLLSCGHSIERNPIEVGLVALPWAYRWSSAATYALGKPDPLLAENAEYLSLGSSAAKRQETWQRSLLAADRREAMARRGDWSIGDEGFRQRVQLEDGRPAARRRGRPPRSASAAR
jgi:putative transposase